MTSATDLALADLCAAFLDQAGTVGLGSQILRIYEQTQVLATLEEVDPAVRGVGVAGVVLGEARAGGLFGVRERLTARVDGGQAVLSGSVSGLPLADYHDSLWVPLPADAGNRLVRVDLAAAGVRVRRDAPVPTLPGLAAAQIVFDRVGVETARSVAPDPARVAAIVADARLLVAAVAVGALDRALTATLDHAARRPMDGARLIDQQAVRHRLADVGARLEAARAALSRGARTREVLARARSGRALVDFLARYLPEDVATCSQFHGGRGFLNTYPVTQLYRDAPALVSVLGAAEHVPVASGWTR